MLRRRKTSRTHNCAGSQGLAYEKIHCLQDLTGNGFDNISGILTCWMQSSGTSRTPVELQICQGTTDYSPFNIQVSAGKSGWMVTNDGDKPRAHVNVVFVNNRERLGSCTGSTLAGGGTTSALY